MIICDKSGSFILLRKNIVHPVYTVPLAFCQVSQSSFLANKGKLAAMINHPHKVLAKALGTEGEVTDLYCRPLGHSLFHSPHLLRQRILTLSHLAGIIQDNTTHTNTHAPV